VLIQLPGVGRSIDSIIAEACRSLGIEPWGGQSENGWSKQSDMLRCPYRFYLKHIRGVGPVAVGTGAGPSLEIGSVVHLLLAARYAALLPDDRYPGWRATTIDPTALLRALEVAGLPLTVSAEVERLYDGYAEKYGAEAIQPVAVEMPAGVATRHTSRFDMVFFIEDGIHDGLWIGEHKTMSSATDIEDFRLDGEVMGEMLSWEISNLSEFFGAPLNGVCVNALVKAAKVPRYQRLWIRYNEADIAKYTANRVLWIKQELFYRKENVWPKSFYGCKAGFRHCRFWEHCRTQDESKLVPLPPRG
jgi:hypothetical protein